MIQNHILSHMLAGLVRDFGQPVMIWQAGLLVGTLIVAWWVARVVWRRLDARRTERREAARFGTESLRKALFPLLGSLLVWLEQAALADYISTSLLELALVPLFGIALIYVVFFVARRVFGRNGHAHAWLALAEKAVGVVVWIAMLLTVLGIHDQVLHWMSSVRFRIGNERMTLLSLSTGILWVCVTLIVALWLGSAFEERVMRARSVDANLRVVLARIGRALLVVAAVLISFSLVGIDITVLGVFGGALGVGLGFGLQKIASNYVSGFIILIDRSLRIGDSINVGGLQGIVTQITARYTTVRGLDGIETLIPNERLITDVVQNQSSFLTRGHAKAAVQIAYDADVDRAMALLAEGRQRRGARTDRSGTDAVLRLVRGGRHQSRARFLDRGCRNGHRCRALSRQPADLAPFRRKRDLDSLPDARRTHRRAAAQRGGSRQRSCGCAGPGPGGHSRSRREPGTRRVLSAAFRHRGCGKTTHDAHRAAAVPPKRRGRDLLQCGNPHLLQTLASIAVQSRPARTVCFRFSDGAPPGVRFRFSGKGLVELPA